MNRLFIVASLAFTATFAQDLTSTNADKSGYTYEERPGIGLFYEASGSMKHVVCQYKVAGNMFNTTWSSNQLMGLGGQLPLNRWLGLNAVVGYQRLKFNYDVGNEAIRQSMVENFSSRLDSNDLKGRLISNNLVVQAGFELGVPFYSSYHQQTMAKVLIFGNGTSGKTFFDKSKFVNATIWGYSYGAALRFAWKSLTVEGGARLSHIYWKTNFDQSNQTGVNYDDDSFMLDYDTPISPYVKATWALY